MKLALVNTKGGVGKTTAAIFLAAGFNAHGRTLLVDCDPQRSAYMWSEEAELPFSVVPWPSTDLAKRVARIAADYEHVVLDTPPGNLPIIKSAVMAADVVLVPVAPSGLDVNRLGPTFDLLAEVEPVHPFEAGVVLSKMRYGTSSARGVREVLAEVGYPVLTAEIPLAEGYAQAFGRAPVDLGAYGQVIKELLS